MKNYRKSFEVYLEGTALEKDGLMNIKTRYTRNRIKGREFSVEEVKYITELMDLEHYVINGPQGYIHGMKIDYLIFTHRKEYKAILKELAPDMDFKHDFSRVPVCRGVDYRTLLYPGSEYYEMVKAQWKDFGGVL